MQARLAECGSPLSSVKRPFRINDSRATEQSHWRINGAIGGYGTVFGKSFARYAGYSPKTLEDVNSYFTDEYYLR
jgi:hypothetical protein